MEHTHSYHGAMSRPKSVPQAYRAHVSCVFSRICHVFVGRVNFNIDMFMQHRFLSVIWNAKFQFF